MNFNNFTQKRIPHNHHERNFPLEYRSVAKDDFTIILQKTAFTLTRDIDTRRTTVSEQRARSRSSLLSHLRRYIRHLDLPPPCSSLSLVAFLTAARYRIIFQLFAISLFYRLYLQLCSTRFHGMSSALLNTSLTHL